MGYVDGTNVNMQRFVPRWNGDGQKIVRAIAGEATTAKMPGGLHMSDSGYVYLSFAALSATGVNKFGVCLEAASSGDEIDVAVAGYVPAVSITGTGTYTTAFSTFTAGDAVELTDTGHLVAYGTTMTNGCWGESTAQADINSVVGVAVSSGQTATVDLIILEKNYVGASST
jgi:hypothetical protein